MITQEVFAEPAAIVRDAPDDQEAAHVPVQGRVSAARARVMKGHMTFGSPEKSDAKEIAKNTANLPRTALL